MNPFVMLGIAYVGIAVFDMVKYKRSFGEAALWPLRSGIKITVWVGKKFPAMKPSMDRLRLDLEEYLKKDDAV